MQKITQLLDFILFMLALFLSGTVAAQSYTAQNTGLISSAEGNQDTLANIFQPLEPLIFLENVQGSTEFSDAIRDKVIVSNTAELFEWMEFVDSLKNEWFSDSLSAHFQSPTLQKSLGEEKAQREQWVVFWLIFLVFLLGVIRYVFSGYVSFLIYSYYQDTAFGQISKEDNQFTSWPFLFMYVFSGLTLALFIYEVLISGHYGNSFPAGIQNYLVLSVSLILLLSLKILFTKFIAFIFESQKVIRQYIVTIYLSYINAGLIALPMVFAMAFLPFEHVRWIIPLTGAIIIIVLLYRVVKVLINLFTQYRFSKFYLIVYLCTLELSPILVLLKLIYR